MVILQQNFVRNLLRNGFHYNKTSLLFKSPCYLQTIFVINFLQNEKQFNTLIFINFLTLIKIIVTAVKIVVFYKHKQIGHFTTEFRKKFLTKWISI